MRSHRPEEPGQAGRNGREPARDEVRRLMPLVRREVEVVDELHERVRRLRDELLAARPATDLPPRQPLLDPPAPTGDDVADAAVLSAAFERLQEQADALWFERQWLTAELSVARGEFDRHGPTAGRLAP